MRRTFAAIGLGAGLALMVVGGIGWAESMAVSPTVPRAPSTTVAGLPTCNAAAQGTFYLVTDALTPVALAAPTGGGAVVVPTVCNGTAWIIT